MAEIAATVLERSDEGTLDPVRFFTGKPFLCEALISGGTECAAHPRPTGGPSAHYLTMPGLESVQELIQSPVDNEPPCRILAGLNRIFPVQKYLAHSFEPQQVLTKAFHAWLESFMSKQVLARFGLSLQILSSTEIGHELFYELPEANAIIQFGFNDFENVYFPLGDVLKTYDEQHPGLARYVLQMLSDCPLHIGTPEIIYEMVSYFCWGGEDNEEVILQERYDEYLEMGESEEDAREAAYETMVVRYAEFEENLPEWTFQRSGQDKAYSGPILPELKNLKRCHIRWKKRKKLHYLYPNYVFPGIVVSLDQQGYAFSCDLINRIGNDQIQCGADYYFTTLAWPLPIHNSGEMQVVFREIQQTLEYFSACMDFLFMHEKEYSDA